MYTLVYESVSAPKPCVTNPTPTHSSNRPCQYSVRIRWLIYSREKSFYLSYGKHWSRRLQSVRMRPPKGNIHTVISFFRITTGANIFETLHFFTAKIHSIYRYLLKYIIFKDIFIKKKSRCTNLF